MKLSFPRALVAFVALAAPIGIANHTDATSLTYINSLSATDARGYRAYVYGGARSWTGANGKEYAETRDPRNQVFPSGSTRATRVLMTVRHSFSGASLSVGASTSGTGSASFSAAGWTCSSNQMDANSYQISYSYNGVVCSANTLAWITKATLKTDGSYKIGSSSYYGISASASLTL